MQEGQENPVSRANRRMIPPPGGIGAPADGEPTGVAAGAAARCRPMARFML